MKIVLYDVHGPVLFCSFAHSNSVSVNNIIKNIGLLFAYLSAWYPLACRMNCFDFKAVFDGSF